MEIPKNVREKFGKKDIDPREQKKNSKLMYQRRIIDKEIKQLLKQPVIRYGEIERVHRKFGVRCLELDKRDNS